MSEPTISELWKEFEKLKYYIDLKNKDVGWCYKKEDADAIRKQLIELVKPWFSWFDNGEIYAEPRMVQYQPTPEKLREYAASYLFAAWEIEQRAKERAVEDGQ